VSSRAGGKRPSRARLPRADLAVVFGSGLSVMPEGAELLEEIVETLCTLVCDTLARVLPDRDRRRSR